MAGDLFIMSLESADIENLRRAGGELVEQVHHADRTAAGDYVTLESRVGSGAMRNRAGLPAHCYIVFQKNNLVADKKYSLCRILKAVSRPLEIVKARADLNSWDNDNDLQRCNTLWAAVQNGPVGIEFYKVGVWGVKTHFNKFQMVNEQ